MYLDVPTKAYIHSSCLFLPPGSLKELRSVCFFLRLWVSIYISSRFCALTPANGPIRHNHYWRCPRWEKTCKKGHHTPPLHPQQLSRQRVRQRIATNVQPFSNIQLVAEYKRSTSHNLINLLRETSRNSEKQMEGSSTIFAASECPRHGSHKDRPAQELTWQDQSGSHLMCNDTECAGPYLMQKKRTLGQLRISFSQT